MMGVPAKMWQRGGASGLVLRESFDRVLIGHTKTKRIAEDGLAETSIFPCFSSPPRLDRVLIRHRFRHQFCARGDLRGSSAQSLYQAESMMP